MALRDRLARWLGLEAKASQTAKLIAWTSAGQPVWTPRDFAALAREGFAKNADRLSLGAHDRRSRGVRAAVPVRGRARGRRRIRCSTLLAQPNPMQCGPDLLEAWYGHLLVAGNAYLEAVVGRRAACASCMCCGPTA